MATPTTSLLSWLQSLDRDPRRKTIGQLVKTLARFFPRGTPSSVTDWLQQRNISLNTPAMNAFQTLGIDTTMPISEIKEVFARLSGTGPPIVGDPGPRSRVPAGKTEPPVASANPVSAAVEPTPAPRSTTFPRLSGTNIIYGDPDPRSGDTRARIITQPPPASTIKPTLVSLLGQAGLSLSTPIQSTLTAIAPFFDDPAQTDTWVMGATARIQSWLQQHHIAGSTPVGQVMQAIGLTGNEDRAAANAAVSRFTGSVPPPTQALPPWPPGGGPGAFPQTPPISLPQGQQPTQFPTLPPPTFPAPPEPFQSVAPPNLPPPPPPFQPVSPPVLPTPPPAFQAPPPVALPTPPPAFQAPPPPALPTQFTLPPELTALLGNIQSSLQAEQSQRQAAQTQLQQQLQQQQERAAANQPLYDLAIQNMQSVLSGQAASPSLQGLVNSAFAPVENEGQRRLRQTAEEAAGSRGFHLTDTPIGQPYLDQTRQFLEQIGGQRAQATIGLRQQDAAFAQQVQQFQEGLRQQALANQMSVIQSMGTPEQAAQILGALGLGSQQAALGQFTAQSQQALNAADLALRQALGQSSAGLQQYGQQSQNVLAAGQLALQQALGASSAGLQQYGQQSQNVLGASDLALRQALGASSAGLQQYGQQSQNVLNAGQLALQQALGRSSAGLQQYGQQSQNALGAGNLTLQQAMSQNAANLANAQFGLSSQAQGFQQQLAKQQASIQNQLALLGLLGDPSSAFSTMGNFGANQNQQVLQNLLGLSGSLLGQPPNFGTTGSTTQTTASTPSNLLGTLGIGALGVGSLFGKGGLFG